MPKLTKNLLIRFIAEEFSRLNEGAEEDAITELTKASADLLKSMEKFQEFMKTSSEVSKAVSPHFDTLLVAVKEFFANPKKFVKVEQPIAAVKPKKKIVLKPSKPAKKVV